MQIRVKLMGVLKAKEPQGNRLDLPDGSTVGEVLKMLDIPDQKVHTFSVNGSFDRDRQRKLESEDELMVLAPVGGG